MIMKIQATLSEISFHCLEESTFMPRCLDALSNKKQSCMGIMVFSCSGIADNFLPKHAPAAWDDCMWLLSLQEGDETREDTEPLLTAFHFFENEMILLKPFLMYCGVFASSITTTNVCYMEESRIRFTDQMVAQSGLFRRIGGNCVDTSATQLSSELQDSDDCADVTPPRHARDQVDDGHHPRARRRLI
jgi:hypothetical protein